MSEVATYDMIVIGSGPGGLQAALHAAKTGCRVLLVEKEMNMGGACVQHGTIPSKTLRETAIALVGFRRRTGIDVALRDDMQVSSLMGRQDQVIKGHQAFMNLQTDRSGIDHWHGRARFRSPVEVEVEGVIGAVHIARGKNIVIATGSRPRDPDDLHVDHEHILDSDSILSMIYLPQSLTVLGSGVIASEYASIFASLGVAVTMIDKYPGPLGFLDPELTERFVASFEAAGGRFLSGRKVTGAEWDQVSHVVTRLDDGEEVRSEKLLVAAGRVANLSGLNIEAAGLAANDRGILEVDEYCRTAVPHIYAAGDVVGPPALAASSMEQGRRAACHALGIDLSIPPETVPIGIYTIPELASVGITESQAIERHGGALVGRAHFGELARGQIAANEEGMLKMIAHPLDHQVVGVQIIGEGAAELIHLGQMAMTTHQKVETFVESIFNFPTLAEAYRVAALEIVLQTQRRHHKPEVAPA